MKNSESRSRKPGKSKPAKRSTLQANKGAKPNPVTQSARFTPEQMAIIEEACRIRQWSISQLLTIAAIEKAVAIKNLHENRREITLDANMLAMALHGMMPKVACAGHELGEPEDPFSGWIAGENGPFMEFPEQNRRPYLAALYEEEDRSISIWNAVPNPVPEDELCKVAPRPVPSDRVGAIFETIDAIAPELAPIVREAYSEFRLRRGGESRRSLVKPSSFLQG